MDVTVDELKNANEMTEKLETDKFDKASGLKERTLAEWGMIYQLLDDGNGGYIIKAYNGTDTVVIIPDIIAKKKVTAIGEEAFSPKKEGAKKESKNTRAEITEVIIPDSVTSIGEDAFEGCTSLTSINIPDGVTEIEWGTFSHCTSLTSITIPNSVTSIGGEAFSRCESLTSITIPDSVTSMGVDIFFSCARLTITAKRGSYAEKYALEYGIKLNIEG